LITSEQKQFLQRRFRAAVSAQPDLKRLKTLLLRFGGDFLVAPPKPDPDIPMLLERGFLTSGPTTLEIMKSSSCHQNVSVVWKSRKFGIVAIATGYALSEDGLWRQHSWGILREGLLETTEARRKYFGIVLHGVGADDFAERNTRPV
jgi:hypothetical protein